MATGTKLRRPARLILMDTREPADLKRFVGAMLEGVEYVALPEADFAIPDRDGCLLGIERKTVNDLIQSLRDGRLVTQLQRMEKSYTYRVLLVEGTYTLTGEAKIMTPGYSGAGWSHASMQMALWSLQQHIAGLVVLWTVNFGGTVDVLRSFQSRAIEKCVRQTDLVKTPPVRMPQPIRSAASR